MDGMAFNWGPTTPVTLDWGCWQGLNWSLALSPGGKTVTYPIDNGVGEGDIGGGYDTTNITTLQYKVRSGRRIVAVRL